MSHRKYIIALSWLMVILIIAGCITMGIAFDKKNNYYNSDYSSFSTNAYVGGDAYNYIINGTYFIGYLVISMNCFLMALLSLLGLLYFSSIDKRKNIAGIADSSIKDTNALPPI